MKAEDQSRLVKQAGVDKGGCSERIPMDNVDPSGSSKEQVNGPTFSDFLKADASGGASHTHSHDSIEGNATSTPAQGLEEIKNIKEKVSGFRAKQSGFGETFLQTFHNYSGSLYNILLILVLLAVQELFEEALFQCPCKSAHRNVIYSLAFVVIPAVVLFGASIALNTLTWRAVTGYCSRRGRARFGCRGWCGILCQILPRSCFGPFVWIVYAFLNGRFYECMFMTGDVCNPVVNVQWLEDEQPVLHTESQLIGVCLLFLGLAIGLLFVCIQRMCSEYPYEYWHYMDIYQNQLEAEIEASFTEYSKALARDDLESFIENVFDRSDMDELHGRGGSDHGKHVREDCEEEWENIAKLFMGNICPRCFY